ncbi:MAG: SDR family NAD(P)-dependent oxidoreductase [Pseudomonadota bacterium]
MSNETGTNKSPGPPNLSILLTGASGSLGRALALQHAASGVNFHIWGRDADRLDETAHSLSNRGARVVTTSFDLADTLGAVHEMIEQDQTERFDIAYFVAGTGETRASKDRVEAPDLVARAVTTNFAAPAAMAAALADRMVERGKGRIVLIGSAAGHHSLPFASAYSGSKAGLARFSDALRLAVRPFGVSVTLAAPGFLDTPHARAEAKVPPFLLSVDEAARRIVRAGENGARHYVTPWPFRALRSVDGILPAPLRDAILSRLGK